MFHPNPQSMSAYGKILNEVLVNNGVQDTFVTSYSAKQTFVSFPNNDEHPYTIIAFAMLPNTTPIKNKMSDASTQTEGYISEIPSFQQHQQFRHHSLAVPQHAFQTPSDLPSPLPSTSTSFSNQAPPPYVFPHPNMNDDMRFRERFYGRGRRAPSREAESSSEGSGGVTLSMFLPGNLNQPPQAFRGRRQRRATRRVRAETAVEPLTRAQTAPPTPNDLSAQMDAELSLIDELFN